MLFAFLCSPYCAGDAQMRTLSHPLHQNCNWSTQQQKLFQVPPASELYPGNKINQKMREGTPEAVEMKTYKDAPWIPLHTEVTKLRTG